MAAAGHGSPQAYPGGPGQAGYLSGGGEQRGASDELAAIRPFGRGQMFAGDLDPGGPKEDDLCTVALAADSRADRGGLGARVLRLCVGPEAGHYYLMSGGGAWR